MKSIQTPATEAEKKEAEERHHRAQKFSSIAGLARDCFVSSFIGIETADLDANALAEDCFQFSVEFHEMLTRKGNEFLGLNGEAKSP